MLHQDLLDAIKKNTLALCMITKSACDTKGKAQTHYRTRVEANAEVL
jgi:hypothetical protein